MIHLQFISNKVSDPPSSDVGGGIASGRGNSKGCGSTGHHMYHGHTDGTWGKTR